MVPRDPLRIMLTSCTCNTAEEGEAGAEAAATAVGVVEGEARVGAVATAEGAGGVAARVVEGEARVGAVAMVARAVVPVDAGQALGVRI